MNMILVLSTQPLVERLGWALVHFLWQGALIACLYLIARTQFVPPQSAGIRYILSCAALGAMIAAPIVTLVTNSSPSPVPAMTLISGVLTAPPVGWPASWLDTF